MLYSHIIHLHLCRWMHKHNTIKTSDTVLYWKGCVCEGVGDRTELQQIDSHSCSPGLLNRGAWGPSLSETCSSIQHLLSNWSDIQLIWSPTATAQSGAWGPTLLGAGFLYRILSPTDWISCALCYIIVQSTPSSSGHHNLALIQPVHGQGYLHRCISYFGSPAGS